MRSIFIFSLCVLLLSSLISQANACPFCSAQSQTFSQEMETMDAVVLAKLVQNVPPPTGSEDPNLPAPKAKFEIYKLLKGTEWVKDKEVIHVLYYGDDTLGTNFMIQGVVEGKDEKIQSLIWSTPMKISEHTQNYLEKVIALPKTSTERLIFFQKYLEDKEPLLSNDAYGEFASAPYEEVIALKPHMNHTELVSWIKNEEIPASRRRLYLTMLGVCGNENDLPLLEDMIRSIDRSRKAGLDALLACYLTLKGEDGLPLIEELYLKNRKAEYADVYAAIMALRFHGTETNIVPQKSIVYSMRNMLNRPEMADLVIPDLARWEDWDSLPTLVELFKKSNGTTNWVREPIVNFVKACKLPEAKTALEELQKIDPEAVKRANRYFPFGAPKPPADVKKTTALNPEEASPRLERVAETVTTVSTQPTASISRNQGAKPAAAAIVEVDPPNRFLLGSVVAAVGLLLAVCQYSLLLGGGTARS
jgi:hypothetical protein